MEGFRGIEKRMEGSFSAWTRTKNLPEAERRLHFIHSMSFEFLLDKAVGINSDITNISTASNLFAPKLHQKRLFENCSISLKR